jgi:hypothetical protein
MITVRTSTDHGPYFDTSRGSYQAARLKDVIFHCRLAMEDGEDIIGIFHDDACIGIWQNEPEVDSDGEGGMMRCANAYVQYRPDGKSPKLFKILCEALQ